MQNRTSRFIKDKDVLDRCFYHAGDIDRQLQGRIVFSCFQPHDGFPTYANHLTELLLGQIFQLPVFFQFTTKFRHVLVLQLIVAIQQIGLQKFDQSQTQSQRGHQKWRQKRGGVQLCRYDHTKGNHLDAKTGGICVGAQFILTEAFVAQNVRKFSVEEETEKSKEGEEQEGKALTRKKVAGNTGKSQQTKQTQPAQFGIDARSVGRLFTWMIGNKLGKILPEYNQNGQSKDNFLHGKIWIDEHKNNGNRNQYGIKGPEKFEGQESLHKNASLQVINISLFKINISLSGWKINSYKKKSEEYFSALPAGISRFLIEHKNKGQKPFGFCPLRIDAS